MHLLRGLLMVLKLLMRMRMRMLLLRRRRLRLRTIHLIRDVSRCSVPSVTTIRRILNLLLLRRWLLLRLLLWMLLFVFGRTLANQGRSVRRECLQIFLFRCFSLLLVDVLMLGLQRVPHRSDDLGNFTEARIWILSFYRSLGISEEQCVRRNGLLRFVGISFLLLFLRFWFPLIFCCNVGRFR